MVALTICELSKHQGKYAKQLLDKVLNEEYITLTNSEKVLLSKSNKDLLTTLIENYFDVELIKSILKTSKRYNDVLIVENGNNIPINKICKSQFVEIKTGYTAGLKYTHDMEQQTLLNIAITKEPEKYGHITFDDTNNSWNMSYKMTSDLCQENLIKKYDNPMYFHSGTESFLNYNGSDFSDSFNKLEYNVFYDNIKEIFKNDRETPVNNFNSWNPADIWLFDSPKTITKFNNEIVEIKNGSCSLIDVNNTIRDYIKTDSIAPISLKKLSGSGKLDLLNISNKTIDFDFTMYDMSSNFEMKNDFEFTAKNIGKVLLSSADGAQMVLTTRSNRTICSRVVTEIENYGYDTKNLCRVGKVPVNVIDKYVEFPTNTRFIIVNDFEIKQNIDYERFLVDYKNILEINCYHDFKTIFKSDFDVVKNVMERFLNFSKNDIIKNPVIIENVDILNWKLVSLYTNFHMFKEFKDQKTVSKIGNKVARSGKKVGEGYAPYYLIS